MLKFFIFGTCLMALMSSTQAFHASVQGDKHWCIIFEGNVTGSITYAKKDQTTSSYNFTVAEDSLNISGECLHTIATKSAETLVVSFLTVNSSEAQQQWSLKIDFVSSKDNSFEIADITLDVSFTPEFNASAPSATYKLKDSGDKWLVDDGEGYTCSSSVFGLDNNSSLEFHNIRVLAFAQLIEDKFPAEQVFNECALDSKTSEIVPIIVGASLAGLVIIVLIAYLIGRARSKRQGYASV